MGEINASPLFDARHCTLAKSMKDAGLPWTPQPGYYVFDQHGLINAPSPFGHAIFFILDLKHFIRRLGSIDGVKADLVWLPTMDQAILLCKKYNVDPAYVESLFVGKTWMTPAESLLALYQALHDMIKEKKEFCHTPGGTPSLDVAKEGAPTDNIEMMHTIQQLFSSAKLAVLATRMDEEPYTNLVAFVSSENLRELFFATTRTTRKFGNLSLHPGVSLLIDSRTHEIADFREAIAVTAVGKAHEVEPSMYTETRDLYLRKHPYLKEFVTSPTCAFVRVNVETYYVVRRFQNVTEVHLSS